MLITKRRTGLIATVASLWLSGLAHAGTVEVSADGYGGLYDFKALAQWASHGTNNVVPEGQLATAVGVTDMSITKSRTWQSDSDYAFQLAFSVASGTVSWGLDFNRDGDFLDPSELATSSVQGLMGRQFTHLRLGMEGNNKADMRVSQLEINGSAIDSGRAFQTSGNAASRLFSDQSGKFGDVRVTGMLQFKGFPWSNDPNVPNLSFELGGGSAVRAPLIVPLPPAVYAGFTLLMLAGGVTVRRCRLLGA
jgi:hypothetical protein